MLTIEMMLETATDARELIRAWVIAKNGGFECREPGPGKVSTRIRSSDGKEDYEVWITSAERWCDCIAFARSRKQMFCKHVAALAFAWMNLSSQPPKLQDLAPKFTRQLEHLDETTMRELLTFAAGQHRDVYDQILSAGEPPRTGRARSA